MNILGINAYHANARQVGAQLSFDTRFLGLGPNMRGLHLEVEMAGRREELHADSVVGTHGASQVARTAGWPPIDIRRSAAFFSLAVQSKLSVQIPLREATVWLPRRLEESPACISR
jgi:flavin-dependent dehydrogenase